MARIGASSVPALIDALKDPNPDVRVQAARSLARMGDSGKAAVLIEIEERNDRPKAILGDVFGVLMGEYIFFHRNQKFTVNKHTTLIVFGKSKISDEKRNKVLRKKIMKVKSKLSTNNSKIGKVVIKSFVDEKELSTLLLSEIDKAIKGE